MPRKYTVLVPLVTFERCVFPHARLEVKTHQAMEQIQRFPVPLVLVGADQGAKRVALFPLDRTSQTLLVQLRFLRRLVGEDRLPSRVPNPFTFGRDGTLRRIVRSILNANGYFLQ